jgi:hypothetical protein
MKTILSALCSILALSAAAAEFQVAPNGSDANPGTADKPFATLEKARDAIRGIQNSESRIQNTVVISAGTYRLAKTFELNEKDSGTIYKGQPGARIVGSIAIPNATVKPVTDPAILDRLVPEMRGQVLEVDLKALGITDFGDIGPRGFRRPYVPAPLELFVDDEPLSLARWPNPGQPGIPIGKVLDKGPVTRDGEKPGRGGIFEFNTDRPGRWSQAEDVWITGTFHIYGWADSTVKVKDFDLQKHTITTVHPHMYGFAGGRPWTRWIALNLLEEIDLPGEYMADKKNGKLYFLPPKGKEMDKCRMEISMLKEPLVAIEGATGVVFDGIGIECARGMGIYIERGANNRIQNCTLRNLGIVAVCIGKGIEPDPLYRHAFTGKPVSRELGSWLEHIYDNPATNRDGGTGHGIVNCRIYNIGAGGISLGGGDRRTLTPAGNFVENCELHHFNRWDRTIKPGVEIDGVGNSIRHCLFHDAPSSAIHLYGNNHVIEYNELHHVMLEGDDMGAFYMGRDCTEFGNILRYNYFHDIGAGNPHNTYGIYFDDSSCGTEAYGNVLVRGGTAAAFLIGGGKYHKVHDNIVVDSALAIHHDNRSQNFGAKHLKRFRIFWDALDAGKPPYSTAYPELAKYWEDKPSQSACPVERNLFVNCKTLTRGKLEWGPYKDNLMIKEDPGFVDLARRDYRLKPDAKVFTLIPNFQPVPFEKMGLIRKDAK